MTKDVLIVVEDAYVDRVAEVADRLRAAGVEVSTAHESTGTVTGSVDDVVALAELQALEGVDLVEEQATYELPPPDSSIQ